MSDLGEWKRVQQLENHPRTGDLLAIHSHNTPSSIIRLLTKSYWSHVGTLVALNECPGELFVIQASHDTGVVLVEVTRYLQNLNGTAAWVPLKHDWALAMNPNYQQDIIKTGLMTTGIGFDMNSLWRGMVERILGPMAPLLTWAFPRMSESLYCSALAALLKMRALLLTGIEYTPGQLVSLSQHLCPVPLWVNSRPFGRRSSD